MLESKVILSKSGNPFKTESAAKSALSRNTEITEPEAYTVAKLDTPEGGWGIVRIDEAPGEGELLTFTPGSQSTDTKEQTSKKTEKPDSKTEKTVSLPKIILNDGEPFAAQADASVAMSQLGIGTNTHQIVTCDTGWAIRRVHEELSQEELEKRAEEDKKEKCFMVTFAPMRDGNDEKTIPIGVNGDVVLCSRNKPIPLLERYLEALDHAEKEIYKVKPGQPLKSVGTMKLYPYTLGEQVPVERFYADRKKGTKENQQVWDRRGIKQDED